MYTLTRGLGIERKGCRKKCGFCIRSVPRETYNAIILLGNQPETCFFLFIICSQQVAVHKKFNIQKLCETDRDNKKRPVYWADTDRQSLIAALGKQQSVLSHRQKRDKRCVGAYQMSTRGYSNL